MFERAVLMATCLVVAAFLFMIVGESLIPDGSLRLPAKSPVGPDAMALPGGRVLRIIPWMSIALVSWVPLAALILTALTKAVGLAATPPNLTLRNLGEVLTGRTLAAAGRSVLLAAVAATIVTVLSLAVVSLSGRAVRSASTAVMLGFAVPGSTVAVAMILGYGRALRDTLALILLAYVAKLWAVGHRSLAGLSASIGPDFAHAARVSGANARQALGGIVLPAIKSALGAGWAMVFIISFHELTMSALLYGPGTETLAVSVLNVQQLGDVTASAALAVVLTLPVIVGAIVVTVARAKRGST
jgi:iron(III) transport system permease protein